MDLIDILERLELDNLKDEVNDARSKVEEQEHIVAHLNRQLKEDMAKEHKARSSNDLEEAQRFARLKRQRKEDLKHEKEVLQEIEIEHDHVEGRIHNLLRDALEQAS